MLTYAIINTIDKDNVDFNEVVQKVSTVRYSLDGSKFLIKYETEPSFIVNGNVVPDAVLNHNNCLTLMSTDEWTEDLY